jgi:hypothetical protein
MKRQEIFGAIVLAAYVIGSFLDTEYFLPKMKYAPDDHTWYIDKYNHEGNHTSK